MYPFERMMKTFKRYVVNHTYPEGCISECFLMDEAMMYAMNYMPNGTKGSHKQARGKWMDDDGLCAYPIDKRGKVEYLEIVQYQQARVPKSITFGEHDQPIGPDAAQLSSLIGNLVRTYVSPIYEAWTNVPNEIKEQIWLGVINTYNINEIHKIFVMKKANISWKGWKYMLRHQAIDKYLTDVERKSNVPKYVKPEDWVKFVDISSTSAALAAREAGKIARSKLKSPHTTGRKGQARVAAELKAKNPDQPLTRTDLFLATHKRKDGSASSPHVDDVIIACESDSSVAQCDLDHDAVTKVFGRDSRGRVRGLGTVSKTALKHSAPYKRALEDEHECNTHLQTEVKRLKEGQMGIRREMDELKQALTQGGTQVRPSTYHGSSSQAQDDSSCQLACTNQPNTNTRQGPCRLLHYVRKEITVALGRVLGLSTEEEGCYRIVVDEILKFDVELLGGEKTFGDLTVGDIISWPTFRTVC
ncbi:hypothetical protein AAC387_Pa10g0766 [Persea americana]